MRKWRSYNRGAGGGVSQVIKWIPFASVVGVYSVICVKVLKIQELICERLNGEELEEG